jgi:multidrug resistance efflux pump
MVPAPLIGRIEAIQTDIKSPKPGTLTQLRVSRFQMVSAGAPVVQVITTDPKVLTSSLAVIQAEVQLLRVGMTPLENTQRNAINYEQLQLDWMRQRVQLATSRVNLQLAETEFQRLDKLFQDRLVSASEHDAARAHANALTTEVMEMEKLVASLEMAIERLRVTAEAVQDPTNQLQAALAVQRAKLELTEAQLTPITLTAPIDGRVSMIHRWEGETVVVGDPIVTITRVKPEHVLGYVPQPIYIQPETNMMVQITSRGLHRQKGIGKILAVGSQLQPIYDNLLTANRFNFMEQGLPFLVSLPPGINVYAGETVDLSILPNSQ